MKSKMLFLAAGAVLLLVGTVSGWAITVTVNGQPLPARPPAVARNGRVLLPMRCVFESPRRDGAVAAGHEDRDRRARRQDRAGDGRPAHGP